MLSYSYIKIFLQSKYILLLLCLAFGRASSQNVTIRGKAHTSYVGKIIQLTTLTDNITGLSQREDEDTIGIDGFFELAMQSEFTQPVFLRIDNVITKLYVEPDYVYGVTIPELDKNYDYNNGADLEVNLGIIGNDTTELNILIFDYEEELNNMFSPGSSANMDKNPLKISGRNTGESRFLSRPVMFRKADSLKRLCDKRYENIHNEYFKNYVEYSIASINASVSRGENFLINSYIIKKPIRYHHYEYMQFFKTCFSGYLQAFSSTRKGTSLNNIINVKADYKTLLDYVKDDKFLKDDSLRELVLIKNLWEFYFNPEYDREGVKSIVSELNQETKIKEHERITSTMLSYFNKMQTGSLAPGFTARTKDGTMGTLASFKNRWVYLNFFSTKNLESLKEMPKIAALKRKFGDKISFLSICLDDSIKTYKEYMRLNPKFDWTIWYNNEQSILRTAKDNYFVTGSEAYFLINNFGYLVQSPATPPSKGIEYKFNLIFKAAKKKTKTGIR